MSASPEYAAEIELWRRRRVERLVSESGWLSLTGLFWLAAGDNSVGADPSSAVVLPGGAPRRAGTIRLGGGGAVFLPADGGDPMPLASDAADSPTVVAFGTARFHLVERSGRLAARVRDVDHVARRSLRPIPAFPVDPAWRFEARLEPYEPPRRIPVPSILGTVELETSPGAVVFSAEGRELRLDPILERGQTDWWIVFGDRTNGSETYAGGRFVYVVPPVGGRTILDFNKAYNPPCVFTPHSTCPLPPSQNRLPIRVEAGEKTYV
ncbi:MAG TPA: DUF1684 domain-containing protein [Thermoanaerobaculia bacterium]|nr:DUF1684 domain-containing protein [Thermoanaerobaculia bacterium]